MELFDPAYPGEILREECIQERGLTITEVAVWELPAPIYPQS
jgi:plasmid maintenance system antidote protein VapI